MVPDLLTSESCGTHGSAEPAAVTKAKARGKVKGKGKAKGKGKSKGKARGKMRSKGKAKTKAATDDLPAAESSTDGGVTKPKAKAKPKTVSKQTSDLWQQLESRDTSEVFEEARVRVAACTKEVEASEHEQQLVEKELEEATLAYQDASAKVEDVAGKETAALDNLKAARAAESAAATALQLSKETHTETSQAFKLLEMEAERRQKLVELNEANRVTQEAVEFATRAVEESKLKEEEVLQAWKETGKESRE